MKEGTAMEDQRQLSMADISTNQGASGSRRRPAAKNGKRANELDGRTWERNSISIWSDIRKTSEEVKLRHPALFPIELVLKIIQCFTARNDKVVLDPFAGIGSTPIAAELMGKIGIGIELSPEYAEKARKRNIPLDFEFDEHGQHIGKSLNRIPLPLRSGERRIYTNDACNLNEYVEPNSVDLVITSPPYWDILLQHRSADQKDIRHYGDAAGDLGKIADYHEFLEALKGVFTSVYGVVKPGKYCIVIVMDLRKKDRFFPLHADVADMMQELGFVFDDLIIWDRRHEYNNMRPLGYPYRFRINKAHEFILIFQKPANGNSA